MRCFDLQVDEAAVTPECLGLGRKGELAAACSALRSELLSGRGIALVRGLSWPSEPALRRCALLVFCAALGLRPVPQSTDLRELVGDVTPWPTDGPDRLYRGYRNPHAQKLHTDSNRPSSFGSGKCDVLVMLCVRPSDVGGTSKLLSAKALHSAIAAERPDVYARLCGGWPWDGERDWMPEWGPQQELGEGLPLLSGGQGGKLHAVQYGKILRQNVEAGFAARAKARAGPEMSAPEREAMDFLEEVANREGLARRVKLQAGEVLLLNNYAWMHGRDAFPEEEADGSKRHMLRVWLKA